MKIQCDAQLEGPELVIYVWGKRVIVAHVPPDVTMTDELAARIAEVWNVSEWALPVQIVRQLAKETPKGAA
jgi:hypothetical protein